MTKQLYKTSDITKYPLPPAEEISRKSMRKILIAHKLAESERHRKEGMRLLGNKLGILEVVLGDPGFGRNDKMLVVDCLRIMRDYGNVDQRNVTEALIEVARNAGLIEPRDRYGRDAFALGC